MSRRSIRRSAVLAIVFPTTLALGACGIGGKENQPAPGPFATLTIRNDSPRLVTAYAARPEGVRNRLGTIPGLGKATYDISENMVAGNGEMRVFVAPLGSNTVYTSDPIYVQRGDHVELAVSSFIR